MRTARAARRAALCLFFSPFALTTLALPRWPFTADSLVDDGAAAIDYLMAEHVRPLPLLCSLARPAMSVHVKPQPCLTAPPHTPLRHTNHSAAGCGRVLHPHPWPQHGRRYPRHADAALPAPGRHQRPLLSLARRRRARFYDTPCAVYVHLSRRHFSALSARKLVDVAEKKLLCRLTRHLVPSSRAQPLAPPMPARAGARSGPFSCSPS